MTDHVDIFVANSSTQDSIHPYSVYERLGKRAFDVLFVLIAAPILIPVIGLLWLAVRQDGGSGFYSQQRIGRDGTPFHCWKLRSMVPNAQQVLQNLLESDEKARAEWARDRKLSNDPRITTLGRALRRTSLDEIPQFWNVLKGEMSVVGPRPVPGDELELYGSSKGDYMRVRPGVTGLWQVSGRNQTTYEERVAMDTSYAKNINLGSDTWIVAKTIMEVLKLGGR